MLKDCSYRQKPDIKEAAMRDMTSNDTSRCSAHSIPLIVTHETFFPLKSKIKGVFCNKTLEFIYLFLFYVLHGTYLEKDISFNGILNRNCLEHSKIDQYFQDEFLQKSTIRGLITFFFISNIKLNNSIIRCQNYICFTIRMRNNLTL